MLLGSPVEAKAMNEPLEYDETGVVDGKERFRAALRVAGKAPGLITSAGVEGMIFDRVLDDFVAWGKDLCWPSGRSLRPEDPADLWETHVGWWLEDRRGGRWPQEAPEPVVARTEFFEPTPMPHTDPKDKPAIDYAKSWLEHFTTIVRDEKAPERASLPYDAMGEYPPVKDAVDPKALRISEELTRIANKQLTRDMLGITSASAAVYVASCAHSEWVPCARVHPDVFESACHDCGIRQSVSEAQWRYMNTQLKHQPPKPVTLPGEYPPVSTPMWVTDGPPVKATPTRRACPACSSTVPAWEPRCRYCGESPVPVWVTK